MHRYPYLGDQDESNKDVGEYEPEHVAKVVDFKAGPFKELLNRKGRKAERRKSKKKSPSGDLGAEDLKRKRALLLRTLSRFACPFQNQKFQSRVRLNPIRNWLSPKLLLFMA